jgi:hypothetical protein
MTHKLRSIPRRYALHGDNSWHMASPQRSWKRLVLEVVQGLPSQFELRDVLASRTKLASEYPANKNVDAKIRQSLQLLRDQGVLQFLGAGRYRRLDVEPRFSPLVDMSVADGYASKSQIAGLVSETWAEMNLYCVNCQNDALDRLPPNAPVADFECSACSARYQMKAKDGRFGNTLLGAAYAPTIEACRSHAMPEYVLIEFDSRFGTVVFVDAVPGSAINENRIVARKPLAATAKRAGWQGCSIDLQDLARVRIVAPAGLERGNVRREWRTARGGNDAEGVGQNE